jgi:hypothetical protein
MVSVSWTWVTIVDVDVQVISTVEPSTTVVSVTGHNSVMVVWTTAGVVSNGSTLGEVRTMLTIVGRLSHWRLRLGDDDGGGDLGLDRAGRGVGLCLGGAGLGDGLGDGADGSVGHDDLGGRGLAVLALALALLLVVLLFFALALVVVVVITAITTMPACPANKGHRAPLSPDGDVGGQGRGREGEECCE